jgi:hypothetical protein
MKTYTDPRVETLDARQLLEALGPAHCGYGPTDPTGGPGELMPLPGGTGRPNGNIVIRGRG